MASRGHGGAGAGLAIARQGTKWGCHPGQAGRAHEASVLTQGPCGSEGSEGSGPWLGSPLRWLALLEPGQQLWSWVDLTGTGWPSASGPEARAA